MGNMCAKEREKGFDKQWDPNSEKMKKRVRAMRRALAQALLEGEVEQTKNKQHIENLKATRDNILRMSAGTEEDDFSRMSREAREKRRKKKALALDIGDDIASKDDTEDIISAQEYDARETYNTQANSPRRNYKPETVAVLAADVDGLVCILRRLALEQLDASGTIPMPAELEMLDILVMLAGVVCGRL